MNEKTCSEILQHIRDEISDVAAYREMLADASGFTARVLAGIVADEESHARFLMETLKRAGVIVPEAVQLEFQAMEATFHAGRQSQR